MESRVNPFSTIITAFSEAKTGNICSSSGVWLSDLNILISTCSGYSLGHRSDTCEYLINYICKIYIKSFANEASYVHTFLNLEMSARKNVWLKISKFYYTKIELHKYLVLLVNFLKFSCLDTSFSYKYIRTCLLDLHTKYM